MIHEKLNEESVAGWVAERSGWRRDDSAVSKEYVFDSFRNAVVFVNRVATVADEIGRYPEIHLHFRTVRLRIHTPGARGVTQADLDLAEKIDVATPRR